jgi:hypothetical protein
MPEHGHRAPPGETYSAKQIADLLCIPCVYLLAGKGQAIFPNTTRAAPSSWVMVVRHGNLSGLPDFPRSGVTVSWRQWRDVVVPVLEDPRWDPRLNIWTGDFIRLKEMVCLALRQSGEAAGYGDPVDLLDC